MTISFQVGNGLEIALSKRNQNFREKQLIPSTEYEMYTTC
jgi:hypothetical protein